MTRAGYEEEAVRKHRESPSSMQRFESAKREETRY